MEIGIEFFRNIFLNKDKIEENKGEDLQIVINWDIK